MTRREPPEATLARVAPLARAIGVTRLAVLTGLDVIGIPVAAAVRPNSRTVAVHQGKGPTLAQAKVSALMEALECFSAETLMLPLRLGSVIEMATLGEVADIARLPRCHGGPDPMTERLLWVEGRDVATGRPVWVPREVVAADFAVPLPPGSGVFQATTNGLGAGNDATEALLHAVCELVERDALTLWDRASEAHRASTLVDPHTVGSPLAGELLARCRAAGAAVAVWDATSDIGIPVFTALLTDPQGRVQPEWGSACRPDSDAALAGALAEAAQSRLTTISGARDDLPPDAYEIETAMERAATLSRWAAASPNRRFHPSSPTAGVTPLTWSLERLARAGMGRVFAVDLTRPELGIPVARAVIPGLEGPSGEAGREYRAGARAVRGVGPAA